MADNMINLAGNQLPPDIALQQAEATRQQQLANILTQQGTQQLPTGSMVSGHFVPSSPFQYLAQYGNIAAGNYLAGKGTEQAQKTAKALREYYAQELQTYRKMQKENPDEALLFGANAYNPALSTSATKQLTQGPKWEKVDKLDNRGNTVTYMMDVNAPNPEGTLRMVGVSKPAVSPAEAARLNWEGIPYGGGGNYGNPAVNTAPVNAPVGTSPVIRNNAPVSIAPNAPAYAQGSVTMQPTSNTVNANQLPIPPQISMAGVSPKKQAEMKGEQLATLQTNVKNAYEAYPVVKEIQTLLPKATSGYLGQGWKQANRLFGLSTESSPIDTQLDILGTKLIMMQPRFEGPQGVLDVKLYEKAAGDIGNANLPVEDRLAALEQIKNMYKRYSPNLDWSFAPTPVAVPTSPSAKQPTPTAKPTLRWNPNTQSFE